MEPRRQRSEPHRQHAQASIASSQRFGGEISFVTLFVLIASAALIGSRNEAADAFLLFTPRSGEGFEWELVLCVTLLCTFFALPLVPLETRHKEHKSRVFLYAVVLVLLSLFIIFDTSVGLVDLLDDGNFTQYDIEERKENLLVSILNIVLVVSIVQIFALRTRWQCVPTPTSARQSLETLIITLVPAVLDGPIVHRITDHEAILLKLAKQRADEFKER